MAQLKEDYSDDLRVIFRHFPLSIHDKAALATQAAEAACLHGTAENTEQIVIPVARWTDPGTRALGRSFAKLPSAHRC